MADAALATNPEQLLASIVAIKAEAKRLEAKLTTALDQLTHLVDECEIDQSFKFNNWFFSCTTRISYDYPQEVREIETILKASKRTAEADGSAIAKTGAAFWTIKAPKP